MFSPNEVYSHGDDAFDGLGSALKKAKNKVKKTAKQAISMPVRAAKVIISKPVQATRYAGRKIDVTSSKSVVRQAGRYVDKNREIIAAGALVAGGTVMIATGVGGAAGAATLSAGIKIGTKALAPKPPRAVASSNVADAIPGISPASAASDQALAQTMAMTGGSAGGGWAESYAPASLPPEMTVPAATGGDPTQTVVDAAQANVATAAAGGSSGGVAGALKMLGPAAAGFFVGGPIGAAVGLGAGALLAKKKGPQGAVSGFGVLNWPQPAGKQAYASVSATVQQRLKDLGYDVGKIDGLLGPYTKNAVTAFEKAWKLPADESWADFTDSLDVAWRGRSTSAPVPKPPAASSVAAAPTQAQAATQAAMSTGKKGFSLPKINFKDPKVIGIAAAVGVGAVLLFMPKGR